MLFLVMFLNWYSISWQRSVRSSGHPFESPVYFSEIKDLLYSETLSSLWRHYSESILVRKPHLRATIIMSLFIFLVEGIHLVKTARNFFLFCLIRWGGHSNSKVHRHKGVRSNFKEVEVLINLLTWPTTWSTGKYKSTLHWFSPSRDISSD